jgi:hypothetical protein
LCSLQLFFFKPPLATPNITTAEYTASGSAPVWLLFSTSISPLTMVISTLVAL